MKILLLISILTLSSCSFFESDYERLIKYVRAQKLKEKQLGIPNPVFEGITEPDFPNEEENNKTFEGVDANKDGIRDDIEIWINRISEDKEVRIATKHYYKLEKEIYVNGKVNSDPRYHSFHVYRVGMAAFCLLKSFGKMRVNYLNKTHKEIDSERIKNLSEITYNNNLRKKLEKEASVLAYEGHYEINKENSYLFCNPSNNLEYLKKVW